MQDNKNRKGNWVVCLDFLFVFNQKNLESHNDYFCQGCL